MRLFFIKYGEKYRRQVFPLLLPEKYHDKYIANSVFFKFLKYMGLLKNHFYLPVDSADFALVCICFRYKFNLWRLSYDWFI